MVKKDATRETKKQRLERKRAEAAQRKKEKADAGASVGAGASSGASMAKRCVRFVTRARYLALAAQNDQLNLRCAKERARLQAWIKMVTVDECEVMYIGNGRFTGANSTELMRMYKQKAAKYNKLDRQTIIMNNQLFDTRVW